MKRIEQYLYAVGKRLPLKEREDIKAELRSTLMDMLEDRYGSEPSEADVDALLIEYGAPEKVAAAYRGKSEYLIGPELFPLFRMVAGIVLAVLAGVQLITGGVMAFTNEMTASGYFEYLAELVGSLFGAFGTVVVVFVILQRFGIQPDFEEENEWHPANLPEVDDIQPVNRIGTIVGITFAVLFIGILAFFPDWIIMVAYPGSLERYANPVLVHYRWWLVLGLGASVVLDIWRLQLGSESLGTRSVRLGLNVYSIFMLYLLIVGHTAWLDAAGASGFLSSIEMLGEAASSGTMGSVTQIIGMHAFRLAFFVALVVTSLETLREIYRLINGGLKPAFLRLDVSE